ncbi:signal peptide peptidase SppA [Desulfogranum mediterraneum]|uniref:signal peptide peptidase SppA n=1 Tax=Desulfogranum mediterraneum TaxID=160661 RepID=UPI0003F75E89|nr:signal peptide peptidase SppA [Desulfogranum mediterraneum]
MKKFFSILWLPFYWLWKCLTTAAALFTSLLLLASLALLAMALLEPPAEKLPESAFLVFAPQGNIVEQRSAIDPLAGVVNKLAGLPVHRDILLQDVLDTITAAADDPRINGLLLAPDRLGRIGLDQVQAIAGAVRRFKETGKPVIATADNYSQSQYYLASSADEIYLHPMGRVRLKGFGLFRLYLKQLLTRLEVDFHVFRVGSFKSALEPLIRDSMSPAAKEANRVWLNALWEVYSSEVAHNREMSSSAFKQLVETLPDRLKEARGDHARMALATGLVDGLKSRQQLATYLATLAGKAEGTAGGFSRIGYERYMETLTPSYSSSAQAADQVGIIVASGNIIYGEGPGNQISSTTLTEQIRQARRNPRIKALVLRISSGGGSAFASELIRQELLAFKDSGRPVVISMGAMAASGGYWLAADADLIVAAPTTLTGSIGVFGAVPTIDKTLKKIGISGDGVATGSTALFGNPASAMSPAESSSHQLGVEHGYRQFLQIVAKGRDMPLTKVRMIAEGRVWDGTSAQRLGLVDRLGTLEDAVNQAAELAGLPPGEAVYLEQKGSGLQNFFQQLSQTLAGRAATSLPWRTILNTLSPSISSSLNQQLSSPPFQGDPGDIYAHALLPASLPALSFAGPSRSL